MGQHYKLRGITFRALSKPVYIFVYLSSLKSPTPPNLIPYLTFHPALYFPSLGFPFLPGDPLSEVRNSKARFFGRYPSLPTGPPKEIQGQVSERMLCLGFSLLLISFIRRSTFTNSYINVDWQAVVQGSEI